MNNQNIIIIITDQTMMSFYATGEKFQFSKMSNPNPNEPRLASPVNIIK